LARAWRLFLKPTHVIALTGSVGKTTAKEMLAALMPEALVTLGNLNNEIGVPLTLLRARAHQKYYVIEMGARHLGDIDLLCEIAEPTIGGVLCVKEVHLSEFGSLENIYTGKSEIFCSPVLVCLADDPKLHAIARAKKKPLLTFGQTPATDVRLLSHTIVNSNMTQCSIAFHNSKKLHYELNHAHDSYGINLAAALAFYQAARLPLEATVAKIKDFKPQRFNAFVSRFGYEVIDDAYNASPESMLSSITTFAQLHGHKVVTLILGDMFELGDAAHIKHKLVADHVLGIKWHSLRVIAIGPLQRTLFDDCLRAGVSAFHFKSVDELIDKEPVLLEYDSVYFLKASNGMHFKKITTFLKESKSG
jgi:UDP-N-acetylmuramoyl-tripeptide--D-alanyl-D-alanine ligase